MVSLYYEEDFIYSNGFEKKMKYEPKWLVYFKNKKPLVKLGQNIVAGESLLEVE